MPCVAEVVNRSLKADCTDYNYVPRFLPFMFMHGHVMSGIYVNTLKLTWRTETLCYVWSMN